MKTTLGILCGGMGDAVLSVDGFQMSRKEVIEIIEGLGGLQAAEAKLVELESCSCIKYLEATLRAYKEFKRREFTKAIKQAYSI